MFPVEVDETAQRLQALALTEVLQGDMARAEVAKAMFELYLAGRINVSFDEHGEPTAELIERQVPVVAFPLFTSPDLARQNEARTIGFKPN